MKKLFFYLFLLILIFTTGCTHKDKQIKHHELKSQEDLIQAIEQYQFDKTDIGLYAITNYISETEFLGYQGTHDVMTGFFTGILHQMPSTYTKLYHYYNEVHLIRLLQLVEKSYDTFEEFLDEDNKFYPEGTEFVDTLWGYFYATGDQRVIKKLCKIQKKDYNHEVKNYAKRTLENKQKIYPEIDMKCK